MTGAKPSSRSPWLWIPSLYFAEGLPYALAPFKYQVKCLQLLRSKFAALDLEHRNALQPLLDRTGCWKPLTTS